MGGEYEGAGESASVGTGTNQRGKCSISVWRLDWGGGGAAELEGKVQHVPGRQGTKTERAHECVCVRARVPAVSDAIGEK